jgi:predicted MFS family arabinose efflux permease
MVILVSSDLTAKRNGFNTLMGLVYTAPSLGAIGGAALQGLITEHLGFNWTFVIFAGVAATSAAVFLRYMPETRGPKRLPVLKTRGMLTRSGL